MPTTWPSASRATTTCSSPAPTACARTSSSSTCAPSRRRRASASRTWPSDSPTTASTLPPCPGPCPAPSWWSPRSRRTSQSSTATATRSSASARRSRRCRTEPTPRTTTCSRTRRTRCTSWRRTSGAGPTPGSRRHTPFPGCAPPSSGLPPAASTTCTVTATSSAPARPWMTSWTRRTGLRLLPTRRRDPARLATPTHAHTHGMNCSGTAATARRDTPVSHLADTRASRRAGAGRYYVAWPWPPRCLSQSAVSSRRREARRVSMTGACFWRCRVTPVRRDS
mmetsp:Transcript_15216/g.44510  ORF Transcript_15216/g.44510 Transcript_15216/m.44510 type:complete len:281 (+) Transcript_15216:2453-3295(+)